MFGVANVSLLAASLLAASISGLLTVVLSLAGIRLFPEFRSREQKAGEYRRDTVSAARAGSSRLACVVGPAMLVGFTVVLAATAYWWPADRSRIGYILAICWAEWSLGFLDDLRKSRGMGLGERIRLVVHVAIAVAAAVSYVALGFGGSAGFWQQWGSAIVVGIALLYMVLAAGFSDGVDGLTSSLMALSCAAYAVLGLLWGSHALGMSAGAGFGIAAGAVVVNAPSNWTRTGTVRRRARGYIGDSGALLAGAVVVGIAITAGAVALLPLLAAGFALEGGTVFLQTGLLTPLFRRRLRLRRFQTATTFVPHTEFPLPFLATPVHHHLNLVGLRPLQVVAAFWAAQIATSVLGLAAALLVSSNWRAVFWASGVVVLLTPAFSLAATKGLFLDVYTADDGIHGLSIRRGLPFQLGHFRLFREVERLPGIHVPTDKLAYVCRPTQRHDTLCWAAFLAEEAGKPDQAHALLRRLPALNVLLRPEAALLLVERAVAAGELPALVENWRRALRFVFQEGRLDGVLEQLATLANDLDKPSLAASLNAHVDAPRLGDTQPERWRSCRR
jgi:UDP-N-acetylmuramyl pentapeptide phosphotransferase/UDP-N-acetylglucosamine-1-phosphate transferase